MLKQSCFYGALFLGAVCTVFADDAVLPTGPAKPAVVTQHFPDRVHEFIWRNWNAVEPAKIAKLIGASVDDVTAIAVSMGLPAQSVVVPEMRARGYVTLIRRNWHLLPYEQLLELLELTPEQLSVMLREEDFLWHKLGQIKPQCDPLRYIAPNDAAKARAAEIRAVVKKDFGDAIKQTGEPRFDFVRQIRDPLPDVPAPEVAADRPESLRIVHSYVAVFGDPLLSPQLNPYPDGLLQRLAASGINGVWLHAVLRDLAPGGEAFPEFGEDHETRLKNLRALAERTQKYGIRLYLYMNEPRGMPPAFFANRPELAGARETHLTAMCTSQPAVREWMGNALAHIFREVPGLGGVYTITASENLTNCASHGDWKSCERCKDRTDADIIAEVNTVIEQGVHRGDPDAHVLVSDWGWRGHGDAPDIIALLPKSVWLMSVSEWHLPIERGGIKSTVGEYSISAVGPGPRSQSHWKVARELGLKIGTEIQFNNTCEIASIPYLPVLDLIAEHCDNLRSKVDLNAMFIGWTMGGYPSPNFQVAERVNRKPVREVNIVLDELAMERFGVEGAPHARKAWTLTSNAFREYPFHISVIYTSPVQWGAANPLYPARTGYSATMWGIPYDDLDGWRGPYPPDIFAQQFEKVAEGWKPGVAELQQAVEKAPAANREEAEADLVYARAAGIHFQSVANQSRFVFARNKLIDPANTLTAEEREALRGEIKKLLESEIALARELYTLTQEDSRIGFEPSCQYFYLPLDLVEKVVNCRWLLANVDAWSKVESP
ncbi:MAG: hypothetical protein SGI88_09615 [Candidatus Hydrogenedentes bacterium]|nr:hypothetical protein [Candidatus Hydrogenedentota bacterium]